MNDSTLHISPPKHIEWAAVAALSMLGLFLLVQTLNGLGEVGRSQTPATNTITVSGQGTASVAPDIATISWSVTNTAATVAEAQAASTKQSNAAIAYVKSQNIADKDIKTTSYNISPQYSYPNPCPPGALCPMYQGSPKITGYQVSQSVDVKIRDLDTVGTILAGLGKLEVQNLYGPSFTLESPTAGQDAARADAIADAKAQANELAKELGVRLVRIVNFSEGGNYPYPVMYGMSAGVATKDAATPPSIPAGENQYSSNVTITYEIR